MISKLGQTMEGLQGENSEVNKQPRRSLRVLEWGQRLGKAISMIMLYRLEAGTLDLEKHTGNYRNSFVIEGGILQEWQCSRRQCFLHM